MKLPFGGKKDKDAVSSGEAKDYKTSIGDTLKSIAQREYGDPNKWEVIYKANKWKIDDPDSIYPGMDLKIPKL